MKIKLFLYAGLVIAAALIFCLPLSGVFGQQQTGTAVTVSPDSGVAGTVVSVQGTINTTGGFYKVLLADLQVANGTAVGNNVTTSFVVPNGVGGKYTLTLEDVNSTAKAQVTFGLIPSGIAAVPTATVLIMLVAVAISFMNMILNRALITKMIGWHEYRSMQKEMSEYNSQRMKALRANDTKTLEKLKKKESQITAMQAKMFKPQLILIPITFIYFIIWPFLTGFFPGAVAYFPGFGAQPFFIWYLLCSFFFGTIASRVIGVTPIQ